MKIFHLQVSSQQATAPSIFKINRLLVTFAALNNEITYGEKVWDGKLSLECESKRLQKPKIESII